MRLIRDWRGLAASDRGASVAVGAFDGVHRGHQAVIAKARAQAQRLGAPLGVVSFAPHPRRFFQKDAAPFGLMKTDQMREALAELGVDILYLLDFDAEMASMSDADFAGQVLGQGLGARHCAVGFDFTFGKGRSGSPEALRSYGETLGFTVDRVERLDDADGLKLSSSAVREALKAGDMQRAAAILGRPFSIRGEVIHGDKRGRTIGVPTANIDLNGYMRPAYGVYAVRVRLTDGRIVDGVASLGLRPMYALETPLLEAWLFDFNEDLYGQTLDVELTAWLRGEEVFDGLDALKAQIEVDASKAKAVLQAF